MTKKKQQPFDFFSDYLDRNCFSTPLNNNELWIGQYFGWLLSFANIKIDYFMMKGHSALALCSFSNNMIKCIWTSITITNLILFYVIFVFRIVFSNLRACVCVWMCFFVSIIYVRCLRHNFVEKRGWNILWRLVLLLQRVACHQQFHWRLQWTKCIPVWDSPLALKQSTKTKLE